MRFNAPDHLVRWQQTGAYPAIHDSMIEAMLEAPPTGPVLDLCCSTGLLGRRIHETFGVKVLGVDADLRALDNGIDAGVFAGEVQPVHLKLSTPGSLMVLACHLSEAGVRYVAARRCILELADAIDLERLSKVLLLVGVETIILEGHVDSSRTVNPLIRADAQAAALVDYRVDKARANTRTLVPRKTL